MTVLYHVSGQIQSTYRIFSQRPYQVQIVSPSLLITVLYHKPISLQSTYLFFVHSSMPFFTAPNLLAMTLSNKYAQQHYLSVFVHLMWHIVQNNDHKQPIPHTTYYFIFSFSFFKTKEKKAQKSRLFWRLKIRCYIRLYYNIT